MNTTETISISKAAQRIIPKLPGVFTLSINEVKNDIKEISRRINVNNKRDRNTDDDDDSICSDDVLDSSYPVQPRSLPNMFMEQCLGDIDFSFSNSSLKDNGLSEIDDSLIVIKHIIATSKDLAQSEIQRESLEELAQVNLILILTYFGKSYALASEREARQFNETKLSEENYLRILQGLNARSIRLYSSYSRQNAMLYHAYVALQKRKNIETEIGAQCDQIRKLIEDKRANPKKSIGSFNNDKCAVVRVRLSKCDREILLYVGLPLITPMGEGTIVNIFPKELKVVIRLPFGLLYSHLNYLVTWKEFRDVSYGFDCASDDHLLNRFDILTNRISIPFQDRINIQNIIESKYIKKDDDVEDECSNEDTEETDEEESEETSNNDNTNNQSNTQDTNHETKQPQKNNSKKTSFEIEKLFPLRVSDNTNNRKVLINKLKDNERDKFSQFDKESMSLTFVHPGALPFIINNSKKHFLVTGNNSSELSTNKNNNIVNRDSSTISFDKTALNEFYNSNNKKNNDLSTNEKFYNTTGSLAWTGNIEMMRSSLNSIGEKIKAIEIDQQIKKSKIDRARIDSAKNSTQTASLRLAMFTRRILHRNKLSSQGITLPIVASNSNKNNNFNKQISSYLNMNSFNNQNQKNNSENNTKIILINSELNQPNTRTSRSKVLVKEGGNIAEVPVVLTGNNNNNSLIDNKGEVESLPNNNKKEVDITISDQPSVLGKRTRSISLAKVTSENIKTNEDENDESEEESDQEQNTQNTSKIIGNKQKRKVRRKGSR